MGKKTWPLPLVWQLSCLVVLTILFACVVRRKLVDVGDEDDIWNTRICSLNSSVARELSLNAPISYARLHIDVEETRWYQRGSYHTSSKDLAVGMPALRQLEHMDGEMVARYGEPCSERTTLSIAASSGINVDASNIVFGVATTLDRLEDSLLAFSHWASNTGARILALVDHQRASAGHIAKVLRDAEDLGLDLQIARQRLAGDASPGDRNFALAKHLYEHHPGEHTEWAAFIDDDTFFPSIEAIQRMLGQYNASDSVYVGGIAEELQQLVNFGYMAYGGGGIFLSMPLLKTVYDHFDQCNEVKWEGGDKRLAQCIYAWSTTKLSWEQGLHQIDLHGDPSGFYEVDREQPLSIHHWKSWNEVDVVGLSAVSAICGAACLLRRYRFIDGWSMTNGFSIFRHADDYDAADAVMEHTWQDLGDYGHTLAPLHPKDEGKVSFRLETNVIEHNVVKQFYVRRTDGGDGVVEVVWRREHERGRLLNRRPYHQSNFRRCREKRCKSGALDA